MLSLTHAVVLVEFIVLLHYINYINISFSPIVVVRGRSAKWSVSVQCNALRNYNPGTQHTMGHAMGVTRFITKLVSKYKRS